MPWGRVDDQHYRHEKVGELAEPLRKGCLALYWLAISWCNDRLTDGRVPAGTVRILGGNAEEAEELVRVNMWERDGSGYRVHDFLDFNQSKEQVIQMRAQRAIAGAAGAAARWHAVSDLPSRVPSTVPSDLPDEMHGGSDAPVSRTPSPVTPVPTSRDELPNLSQAVIESLETRTGRSAITAGPRQLAELDRLVEDHGPDKVIKAMSAINAGERITARQLVWAVVKFLEPIPSGKDVIQAEVDHSHQRQIDRTQEYLRQLRGETA